jgi:hypothetical protein
LKLPEVIKELLAAANMLNRPIAPPSAPPPPLLGLPEETIEILNDFPASWEAATAAERNTILYHLVLASPWPPSATPNHWRLAKALSLAFSHTYKTFGRGTRLADKLIPWCLATISSIQSARETAFTTLHRPPAHPPNN